MNRYAIRDTIRTLNNLCDEYNYNMVELGVVLFLRTDLYTFENCMSDEDILELLKVIKNCDTLLDCDIKDTIDMIVDEEDSYFKGESE